MIRCCLLQIDPHSGPVQGGTALTIRGVNLGKSYAEIEHGVTILVGSDPVRCDVNEEMDHNPSLVRCTTSEAHEGSGKVRVNIEGSNPNLRAESNSKFTFYVSDSIILCPRASQLLAFDALIS